MHLIFVFRKYCACAYHEPVLLRLLGRHEWLQIRWAMIESLIVEKNFATTSPWTFLSTSNFQKNTMQLGYDQTSAPFPPHSPRFSVLSFPILLASFLGVTKTTACFHNDIRRLSRGANMRTQRLKEIYANVSSSN